VLIDAEAGCGVGYLAEEGSRETAVEAQDAVMLEDMHEGADHAFGHVWLAGLEADLSELA